MPGSITEVIGPGRSQSASARAHRPRPSGVAPQPKDGDRRRRGPDLARLEQERKDAAREWNLDVGWTDATMGPE